MGVSWRGESQEVAKPTGSAWLKMKEACKIYLYKPNIYKEYENICNNAYKKSKITKHKYRQIPRVVLQCEIIKQKSLARKINTLNI